MVEIMFPEIRPSSILFEKMLSIRVLECVVTRDGVEVSGRRKSTWSLMFWWFIEESLRGDSYTIYMVAHN